MIRSILAVAAGYFSMAFLNSFIHLVISFYFRTEISLFGIASLPSLTWTAGVTILQFIFGMFGGLLSATIANKNSYVLPAFILLIVAVSLIDYSMLGDREPLWYLITAPILEIGGIITGFRLQRKQMQPTS